MLVDRDQVADALARLLGNAAHRAGSLSRVRVQLVETEALESLGIINQALASIAKKEEILYVYGQENEPIVLQRHSPVLHLIQRIRDETHRFAVTFHRLRRGRRQTKSALEGIPGIGEKTARKLLKEFGSVTNVQRASVDRLSELIPRGRAERVLAALAKLQEQL